jgi:PAS domain S-box-containing protein
LSEEILESAQLLTAGQAARLLRVDNATLRRWEQEGYLQTTKTASQNQPRYYKHQIVTLRQLSDYHSRLRRLSSRQLLSLLAGLTRQISSNLNPEQLGRMVLNETLPLVGAKYGAIYLFNEQRTQLSPFVLASTASYEALKEPFLSVSFDPSSQLLGNIADLRKVYYLSDTEQDAERVSLYKQLKIRALLVAPLRNRNEVLMGVMGFFWEGRPRIFADKELVYVEALAAQTAVALESAHLHSSQRAHLNYLETLFDTIADGLAVYDPQLRIVQLNKAATQILRKIDQLPYESSAERVKHYQVRKIDGTPLPPHEIPAYRVAVLGETILNYEVLLDGESGPDTAVSCSGAPFYDESGKLKGGIVVFRNVTEQHRVQEKLLHLSEEAQANAAKLEAVLDSTAQAMLVYDNQHRIILANQRLAQLYGFSQSEIVGLTSAEFAEKVEGLFASREALAAAIRRIEQVDNTSYTEEFELIAPQRRTIQRRVTPVIDGQGRVLGKVAIYNDITEERALARAKDEFISLATHELKTLLTAVTGYTQLIVSRLERYIEQVSKSEVKDFAPLNTLLNTARRVNEHAERLSSLMNDLLDISRLSTGRLQLNKEPLNFVGLVRRVVEQVQITAHEHQLNLQILHENIPELNGDPNRLEQLLRNLLENAVKYSPDGGPVEIRVSTDEVLKEIQVEIADKGIGILPEQQAFLFEKFYRASNASNVALGLGLGLSICAEIVRLHGGRIWVESEGENKGSRFIFTLPLIITS